MTIKFVGGMAAAAILGSLAAAAPASAEGWAIDAFEQEASTQSCMARAERIFRRYATIRAVGNIMNTEWTVYAYEIGGQGLDSIVMCRTDDGGRVMPYLVTHSDDRRDNDREAAHNAMRDLWTAPK